MSQDEKNGITLSPTHSYSDIQIQKRILSVRGKQVMLDRDLAELYGVSTKVLNQAVKRNLNRFPDNFMLQFSPEEMNELVTNCDRFEKLKHSSVMPHAFTEQGVAMLSAVLRSDTAVSVSIRIMDAFVAMRHFMLNNAQIFQRIESLELKQLKSDEKIEAILNRLDAAETPVQGVFFDGQIWDAHILMTTLIGKASHSILLIDNYVDITTLDMLSRKQSNVKVKIVTSPRGNMLTASDIKKFNAQYPAVTVKTNTAFHDRFLILDSKELYLIGASLKDLGKKCFGFTQMDASLIPEILAKI